MRTTILSSNASALARAVPAWAIGVTAVALLAAHAGAATWQQGPGSVPSRTNHAMAFDTARGVVVMFGGYPDAPPALDDTWEFDGTAWRSGAVAPAGLTPRDGHALAYDATLQRVVLFGGNDALGLRNDTWEYDGTRWTSGGAAPAALTPRNFVAMAYDAARGHTVLFGGFDTTSVRNDTWFYDGAWSPGPAAPAGLLPRANHAMAYDATRQVVVIFGGAAPPSTQFADTWELGAAGYNQGPTAPAGLTARTGHGMAFDGQRIALFGGFTPPNPMNDTWYYDGSSWQAGPAAPAALAARRNTAMAYDGNRGKIVMFGGEDVTTMRDTWELDAGGWNAAAGSPPGSSGHAAAYDFVRRRLVLFGGFTSAGRIGETWELDDQTWIQGPAAPPQLTPRFRHAMAYDSSRRVTVLFGGNDGGLRNDTWEYDGNGWGAGPAGAVPAREHHAMAFDAWRGVTVLFGGRDSVSSMNDTWEYDGTGWSPGAAAPGSLEPRIEQAMAFDSRHGVVVLFGGLGLSTLGDTWTYEGTAWTAGPASPAPSARYGHALASDPASGLTVLFGGTDGGGWLDDTWFFDGTRWISNALTPTPPGREGHTLTFDVIRGRAVVLFGFAGGYRYDSWELGGRESLVAGEGLAQVNSNRVRTFDRRQAQQQEIVAYAAGQWGVNVAAAHPDTGTADVVLTGPGPGDVYGPQVRAFRADGTSVGKINFYAYGTLKFGVNPGAGAIDGDAFDELLTGPGPGAVFGPHVRGWNVDGGSLTPIAKINYFAYGTLKFGVNVAAGDIDGDGFFEILTGPGPGVVFPPQVRGWNFDGGTLASMAKVNFNAFSTPSYGALAGSGDVDGDAFDELVAAPGPGGSAAFAARFRGYDFDATTVAALPGFDFTLPNASMYGGRFDVGDLGGVAFDALACASGPDPNVDSLVSTYGYDGTLLELLAPPLVTFGGNMYGANVAAASLDY